MRRTLAFCLTLGIAVCAGRPAPAQEIAHFEGYFVNSVHPPTNPDPGVTGLEGRGLVTRIFNIPYNPIKNEYTWVLKGLVPTGNSVSGTQTYTTYDVSSASLTFYEDSTQDAQPTFYDCPADVTPHDPREVNGRVFYTWKFLSFTSTFDTATQQGSYSGAIVPGVPYTQPPCDVSALSADHLTLGGTTNANFACTPEAGYDQAATGRIFCLTTECCPFTGVHTSSWGRLRRLFYR